MRKLRVLDLFSGIGGFSLGLERTGGFETVAFCEIDPYCQKVLTKHWQGVPIYEDVRDLTSARLASDGIAVDVITGGFPCQDISCAGRREGISDGTRSGLWSEIGRLIDEIQPRYVIVENVANLLAGPSEQPGGWFGRVLGDLAEIGYDAEWHCIPAAYVGLPHSRDRVWLVAHPKQVRCLRLDEDLKDKCAQIDQPRNHPRWADTLSVLPSVDEFFSYRGEDFERNDNGIPEGLDGLGALGNAVVPQIPEMIGRAILKAAE